MAYFSSSTFRFLDDLAANNDRDWFQAHKDTFEAHVREPALRFISDAGAWFETAGLPFVATAKKAGGSLSMINRDVRFSNDKTPYHEHVTIHFRHRSAAKGQAAPALGIRIGRDGVGMGGGLYGGDTAALNQVRDAIVADPPGWHAATEGLSLWGDSLKTAPKGYDKAHPDIEDIRRKAFMASVPMSRGDLTGDLMAVFQGGAMRLRPFTDFLANALLP